MHSVWLTVHVDQLHSMWRTVHVDQLYSMWRTVHVDQLYTCNEPRLCRTCLKHNFKRLYLAQNCTGITSNFLFMLYLFSFVMNVKMHCTAIEHTALR